MTRSAARNLLPCCYCTIINPTSIDARTKMIDLRERESTEISDTNEETNIAISMELAAP